MNETLRGTGRTTRMLEHAREIAEGGNAVYVIADNHPQARQFQQQIDEHPNGRQGIQVEVPDGLGNFYWQSMNLRGSWPGCIVLVDHYAIERRFARMLEMLHRYDSPGKADT